MRLGACAGRSIRFSQMAVITCTKGNRTSIGTPSLKRLFVRHEDGPSARCGHARTCRPSCSLVNVTPSIGWLPGTPRIKPTTSPGRSASLFDRRRKRKTGRTSSSGRVSPRGRLSETVCAKYAFGGQHCARPPSVRVKIGGRKRASPSARAPSWSCTRQRSSTDKAMKTGTRPTQNNKKCFFQDLSNTWIMDGSPDLLAGGRTRPPGRASRAESHPPALDGASSVLTHV